jgi:hypothetical protein
MIWLQQQANLQAALNLGDSSDTYYKLSHVSFGQKI